MNKKCTFCSVINLLLLLSCSGKLRHCAANTNNLSTSNILLSGKFGQNIGKCFEEQSLIHCLQLEFVRILNRALNDNSTWRFSDFMQIEKDVNSTKLSIETTTPRRLTSFNNIIEEKLIHLIQSRSIRMKMPFTDGSLFQNEGMNEWMWAKLAKAFCNGFEVIKT